MRGQILLAMQSLLQKLGSVSDIRRHISSSIFAQTISVVIGGTVGKRQKIIQWSWLNIQIYHSKKPMGNQGTLATLGIQDTGRRQTKHNTTLKTKRCAAQTPSNTGDEPMCSLMGKQFLFLIRHPSCYTHL